MCGIAIDVEGDRILGIRGDPQDPFSQGHICPKAVALKDIHEDPDRLRSPMRRDGSTWVPMGWDDAYRLIGERLTSTQKRHGRNSVAVYLGNPMVHSYGALLFSQLFVRALRTFNRFSATSIDQLPHMFAALQMFGHQLLLPVPDIDRTQYMLILGANPLASNGSLMSAPNVAKRLRALRERGGRLVVIDPRRTETAKIADEHHFIRPGTDALLLLAILDTLFKGKAINLGRLQPYTDGLDVIRDQCSAFPAERVNDIIGIEAATIRRIALDFAQSPSAVCYGRVGVSTQAFGGLCCWLINVLNATTGNLDRVGGAMFPGPAIDLLNLGSRLGLKGHYDKRRTRVRGLPEFGGEFPVASLAEEIETPGPGQIHGLVTCAGNPVLSAPNGKRLDRALSSLEFMVSVDIYINETTRHADVILPPASALERDHYDIVLHALAVRNTAKYSEPLFQRSESARHDWEILLSLASALEGHKGFVANLKAKAQDAILHRLGPHGLLDILLRSGPYGLRARSWQNALSLSRLRQSPHGIDLGALKPNALPERLFTPSGRLHLAPDALVRDLDRLQDTLAAHAPSSPHPLMLIGRRDLRSNNSWMHNSARLVKGPKRCTLYMHPHDAQTRSIANGQVAQVESRVGKVDVQVEIYDDILQGVVSLPHGWGHGQTGTRMHIADAHAGVSINDLTDDEALDKLTGNAAFSGVHVQVTASGPAKALT